MKNNTPYQFDFSIVRFLLRAKRISEQLKVDCISDIICLATIMLHEESSIHTELLKKGVSSQIINDVAETIFSEHSDTILAQTPYFTIEIPDVHENFAVSKETCKLFGKANAIARTSFKKDVICYPHMISAIIESMPHTYERFLKLCNSLPQPNNLLEKKLNVNLVIPKEIAGCITILNNEYSPDEKYCRILGREKETRKLTAILAKNTKRNAVLVGEPGVGKTAIINKLTWEVVTGNAPKFFKNSVFLLLDINSIVAGTKYRGEAEKRFEILVKFIEEHPECVLCIDEIHTMLGAGACREGEMDMANALKPLLARGEAQVIGATTQAEYKKYFSSDGALKRRFEKVDVPEPKIGEIKDMIKNQVRYLSEAHRVTISQELVDQIIFLASCFSYETKNPDRTLDLIDKSMALAKLNNQKEVTLENVRENFDVNREVFEKTPLEVRKAIAHHEVGHFLVNYFSPLLTNINVIAVSVMPGEGYYGVNVLERDDDIMTLGNREYYVQFIAEKLAGRVAEEMFSSNLTDGASSDLNKATRIAEECVISYGLAENFTRNRVYPDANNNPFFTSKVADLANPEVNTLLKDAEKYAFDLLQEKKLYLDALVDALLEKGMMSIDEIKNLFKQIDEQNNQLPNFPEII